MENLKEKAEALDTAAQSITKMPITYLVIVVLAYSYFLYTIARDSADENNAYLTKENERLAKQAEICQEENTRFYRELLQQNGIIEKQKEVIKIADSTLILKQ